MQRVFLLLFIIFVAFGVSTCSSFIPPTLHSTPTTQTMPKHSINDACKQTIVEFLQVNPCENWNDFHDLFSTDSRHFQSTPVVISDPACGLKASNTVLQILPVDEWWQAENPGQPLPEAAQPTQDGEIVFFIEYNAEWQPGVIPASENPGRMLIWMVFDNDSGNCLIRDFGW